jgi:UDP-N-acetyl-2-amino-2-deoxyglucuronate dehydrogenase
MSEIVKFVVAGCGHIGKRHAEMIVRNPEAELVAMIDTNPAMEAEVKEKFNVPFFTSLEAFFASGLKTDAVTVATPNGVHASLSIQALENSCHVIIEKPMALTKADCEKIIFKSLQMSKMVFVVKQNRYSPPSKWLKEVVEKKIIGDVLMVQTNCYWNRDERYYKKGGWKGSRELDGGTLFTQFSHFVDIMYWVFGDVKNIKANFANFNHQSTIEFEDSGMVVFDFINGGMGVINYSTSVWDKNMESSMTVVGTKGSLKIGGQYMNEVEYCHIENYTLPQLAETNPPNDYGPYKGSAANHHYVIENVVDTLLGRGKIDTNALEGLKVVDIIERIYEHNPFIGQAE